MTEPFLAPDNKEKEQLVKWMVKDAQIMSWIVQSREPSMILRLTRLLKTCEVTLIK